MTRPRIELDYRSLFWRTVALIFFLTQLLLWMHFPRRGRPGLRLFLSLSTIPSSLIIAMIVAGITTALSAMLVVWVIRPLVAAWRTPLVDDSLGPFHLAASERVLNSSPARRSMGWRWPAGILVRTNQRLWFFPRSHEADVWSCSLETLENVVLEPAPQVAGSLIRNWPERVAIHAGNDSPEVFAVPEPQFVTSWLKSTLNTPVVQTVRS